MLNVIDLPSHTADPPADSVRRLIQASCNRFAAISLQFMASLESGIAKL